ncbi:hypothetical protein EMIT0P260_30161 [Pseudomonas sp. IT-P260]
MDSRERMLRKDNTPGRHCDQWARKTVKMTSDVLEFLYEQLRKFFFCSMRSTVFIPYKIILYWVQVVKYMAAYVTDPAKLFKNASGH